MTVALRSQEPWGEASLRAVLDLTSKVEALDSVSRVDSLSTVPLIRRRGDALLVSPGLDDETVESPENVGLPATVRRDLIAPKSLVSRDERTFALNIVLDEDVAGIRDATVTEIAELVSAHGGLVTGVPVFRTEVNSQTRRELSIFIPVTLALLGSVVWALTRSWLRTLVPLLVGGVGVLFALGAMALVGEPLSLSTVILPPMLLALGTAYSMHVVMHSTSRLPSLANAIALSGATTAIGFIAMSTTTIDAIRALATYGAVGVFGATTAALSLAPAAIVLGGARIACPQLPLTRLTALLVSAATNRRGPVIVAWCAVLMVSLGGLRALDVSTDIIQWFPHGSDARDDYEAIRGDLSGITPVTVLVESTSSDSIPANDVAVVSSIDALSDSLRELPSVGKVLSIADPLRLMRREMLGLEEDELPRTTQEIAQYLVLLEGIPQIEEAIHRDRTSAVISLRLDDNSSDEILKIGDIVARWWTKHGVPNYQATTTGIMYEFARAEDAIARGQIYGLAVAALAVAIVLLVVLRDIRMSLAAMLVNLMPIGVAFGAMGYFAIPLDAATVCLGSMALGIAVDDTVHLVSAITDARAAGRNGPVALAAALELVLPALIGTTIAIAIGFAAIALSQFQLIQNLGIVTAGLVCLCLLADITLLPALLPEVRERARS